MGKNRKMQEGWDYIINSQTSIGAANLGNDYVERVDNEIQKLKDDFLQRGKSDQGVGQLKGFIAEDWHADTFNINAVLRGSKNRAYVEGSTGHASVDISTNFGSDYSLKYYATGKESARNQAKNVIEAYYEYRKKSKSKNPMSFEDYLERNGYKNENADLLRSVYYGQGRIVPSDQLDDAIAEIEKQIAVESLKDGNNRALVLENYKETLKNLSDRIKDNQGTESIPLTKEEAEIIAELSKEGKFNPEDFGISLDNLITSEYILQQALKAGTTAAVTTLVFQLAPDIYKAIDYLVKNRELDIDELKQSGLEALSTSAESFIRGSIAAAITIGCKAGKLGTAAMNLGPGEIGAVTAIMINTMKDSCAVANGKMSVREMNTNLTKELLISSASLVGGTLGQTILPELPVLGYMLGSVMGSVIASVTINASEKTILSFCAQSGFALFGLVEQDYKMPDEVFARLGISTVDIEKISVKRISYKEVSYKKVVYKKSQYKTIEFNMLRRGVISVNVIGYS